MSQARAPAAERGGELTELPTRTSSRETGDDAAPSATTRAPRPSRWRWVILAVVAAGTGALFLWTPGGGDDAERRFGAMGERATTVSVGEVERGTITERATYPGEIVSDAADLASRIGGRLLEVNVRIGDEVARGDVLARLDANDLRAQRAEASAQVEAATATERRVRVELEAARRELERGQQLHDRQVVSEQEVDGIRDRVASLQEDVLQASAERARAQARIEVLDQEIREAVIAAPFAGTVTDRYIDPGSFVQAGTRIVRVVENGPLRVRFEVPERDVGSFGKDARFEVRAPPTGERTFSGVVTGAAREVERERRIARVEGTVDEPPTSWLAGMYAEVVTARRELRDELLVPSRALVSRLTHTGEIEYGVFVPREGAAHWVPVQVLGREHDKAAVAGALEPGDRVLVGGHTDLTDGARINIAGERSERGEGQG
jgi:membrane fusion protein, multidrug efflux system